MLDTFFSLSSVSFCSFSVAFFSMASVYCIGRNGQMDGWEGHGTELKVSTKHGRATIHASGLYQNVSSHLIAPFRVYVDLHNPSQVFTLLLSLHRKRYHCTLRARPHGSPTCDMREGEWRLDSGSSGKTCLVRRSGVLTLVLFRAA